MIELLATDHSSEVSAAATAMLDGPAAVGADEPTRAWPAPDAVTLEVPEIGDDGGRHPQGTPNASDWLDDVLPAPPPDDAPR